MSLPKCGGGFHISDLFGSISDFIFEGTERGEQNVSLVDAKSVYRVIPISKQPQIFGAMRSQESVRCRRHSCIMINVGIQRENGTIQRPHLP